MFLEPMNKTVAKVFEYVLYIFIAVFPFLIYQGFLFYGTATRSFNLVLVAEILSIIFAIVLFKKGSTLSILKSPINLALGIFLIVLFVSSLNGVDFLASFWSKATRMTGLFYFLHLGLFYLFCLQLFKSEQKLQRFLNIFLCSAGLFSVLSLLSKDGFSLIFTTKSWVGFTIGNSTFAGMYIYAAFLLSIYWVVSKGKEVKRWWHNLIPLIFLINPYVINREFWLGRANFPKDLLSIIGEAQATAYTILFSLVFLVCLWLALKLKDQKKQKIIVYSFSLIGLILGGIVFTSFLSTGGYLQQQYLKRSSPARPIVWDLSREAIKARPTLGWGIDNFDRAFEIYYDNGLLEGRNGGEAWFDRAHNVFLDQIVETGYVGLLSYLLIYLTIIGCAVYVFLYSKLKNDRYLAAVLMVYFVGHLLELQTAFDTTISYVPIIFMAAIVAVLFHKTYRENKKASLVWLAPEYLRYTFATVLIALNIYLFFWGTVPILRAEIANENIRTVGSSQKRLPLYPVLFGSPVDEATFLWKTSTDLQHGIALNQAVLADPKDVESIKKELALMALEYEKYLALHPTDYRSHLGLVNIYIYQRLFEVNNLDKAQVVLDQALLLSPEPPQAYWMKAVAYLYMGKFTLAREWAKKGYDLNPDIEKSKQVVDYIDRSIKDFPEIDLYAFW